MIPTVLLLGLIGGLFVPRTWQWMAGVIAVISVGWAAVIAFIPDATVAIVAAAAGLAMLNAAIGMGLGLVVRRWFLRRRSAPTA